MTADLVGNLDDSRAWSRMMIKTNGVYKTGVPVDDLGRAERFYTEVLGLKVDRPRREGDQVSRLTCGGDVVVLFQRHTPSDANPTRKPAPTHQAFAIDNSAFDEAVTSLKKAGAFHEIVDRDRGRTIYFWDPEGNYQELRAGR